jgi:hypothetical protein
MSTRLSTWMESVSGAGWHWYVKYLSGNDTLLNGSHQAGPYVPKSLAFRLFPSLRSGGTNPRADIAAEIDSHSVVASPRIIWYNNKTRNECRLTSWGGGKSPILDPEATGSLCVFAFQKPLGADANVCRVWLCDDMVEEDMVLDRVGVVEPNEGLEFDASGKSGIPFRVEHEVAPDLPCRLRENEVRPEWKTIFPSAEEVHELSVSRLPSSRALAVDKRILVRRECEYEVFRSIEEAAVLPRIREAFATVDLFVDFANSVTNRRKSRSGASLELQARRIFQEEQLPHSYDQISEGRKRPDFLFPNVEAYRDKSYSVERLQMLGVKTTCKDRWRQVINEADRIDVKYLLTLQEGISPSQFAEMQKEGVRLVVPLPLHRKYSTEMRSQILSLADFIRLTRDKTAN